jgi:hypothetical protein
MPICSMRPAHPRFDLQLSSVLCSRLGGGFRGREGDRCRVEVAEGTCNSSHNARKTEMKFIRMQLSYINQ